jgi:hypothetical protein
LVPLSKSLSLLLLLLLLTPLLWWAVCLGEARAPSPSLSLADDALTLVSSGSA